MVASEKKNRFRCLHCVLLHETLKKHILFSPAKEPLEGLIALFKYIRRVNSREIEPFKPKNNVGTGTNGLKVAMNKFRVELGLSPLDQEGLFGNKRTGTKFLPS